jgi:hypothetical protein
MLAMWNVIKKSLDQLAELRQIPLTVSASRRSLGNTIKSYLISRFSISPMPSCNSFFPEFTPIGGGATRDLAGRTGCGELKRHAHLYGIGKVCLINYRYLRESEINNSQPVSQQLSRRLVIFVHIFSDNPRIVRYTSLNPSPTHASMTTHRLPTTHRPLTKNCLQPNPLPP